MEQSSSPPSIRHWPLADQERYAGWVQRRRALALPGYLSFADVGLDGQWTTPYHLSACSPNGPVLLTYNYLDAPSAIEHRTALGQLGYLPSMPFNRVLDLALSKAGLKRSDIYVTHAFHLLPATRSAAVASKHIDISFDAVARYEIEGRRIVALGEVAARVCRRHGLAHTAVPHPSARGFDFAKRAGLIASALA
ncbi:hypothetical protein VW35_06405 [Devosia soli]|uniref:Uncharacterized protein n=1 Tax=Devosia soli TaxID=361041 RepID=A0A0F5LCU3_9HYPH|nr:hypothetical protein [Devosia soli]KKB80070.1 hypothetical protein VW35_06405 [Devosia soli]